MKNLAYSTYVSHLFKGFKSVAIILFVAFNIFLVGCSKTGTSPSNVTPTPPAAPTVDFAYDGANKPAPATVTFTGSATNATSYKWDFGDNTSSTDLNTTHNYTTGGVYTVKLTATGQGGSTSTSKTINIAAAYTKVTITKVTVVNLPFINPQTSTSWDSFDGPDVYFKIEDYLSNVLASYNTLKKDNVTLGMLPLVYDLSDVYVVNDLTAPIFIQLFNYNILPPIDDDMGYVGFQLSNYTTLPNPYPASIQATSIDKLMTIKLDLTWQ